MYILCCEEKYISSMYRLAGSSATTSVGSCWLGPTLNQVLQRRYFEQSYLKQSDSENFEPYIILTNLNYDLI